MKVHITGSKRKFMFSTIKIIAAIVIFQIGLLPVAAQTAINLLKRSCDSLGKKQLISYRITQPVSSKPQKISGGIQVIIERNNNPAFPTAYIIRSDSLELIFDGKFGFIVNHSGKTVKQVNEQMIKKHPLIVPSQVTFFTEYCKLLDSLNKKFLQKKGQDWILQFRMEKANHLIKTGINKNTMLPSFVSITDANKQTRNYPIQYESFSDIKKPNMQIVGYIDSYSLLPLDSGTFKNTKDARDSLSGQQAFDFSLRDFAGNKISLSDYKGKYVLLDFWEVWCGPCRMSMTHLNDLQKKYREKGLVVIGITQDNPAIAAKIARDKGLNYINVQGNEKMKTFYRVMEIPQYYLINKEGIIIYAGKNGFEKKIEEIIQRALD
jgi:peroxiredoxin